MPARSLLRPCALAAVLPLLLAASAAPAPHDLRRTVAATPDGAVVRLVEGVHRFRDFDRHLIGVDLGHRGLRGAGSRRTTVRMTAHSSTRRGDVPTRDYDTNQLYLISTLGGTPGLSGFTLRGSEQGHLYNGLRIGRATGARVTDVRVEDVPGDDSHPPGETFGINDWRTRGSVYERIRVDGGGIGAAGFGANSSVGLTVRDSTFTGARSSSGGAFWRSRDITLIDVRVIRNRSGLNFERDRGRITLVRPEFRGNRKYDLQFGTADASADVVIRDPVLDPGQRLRVRVPARYHGRPGGQRRSDIRVTVHGVDRTGDLVQWL